jgi:hypothetical protein
MPLTLTSPGPKERAAGEAPDQADPGEPRDDHLAPAAPGAGFYGEQRAGSAH